MKYNVEYIFQPSQKEARKPNPPRVPWKMWSKRGDFCRLCTPGYSSLGKVHLIWQGGGWRYWGGAPKIFRHPKGGLWKKCCARRGGAPKICIFQNQHMTSSYRSDGFQLNNLMTCATQLYHVVYRYNKLLLHSCSSQKCFRKLYHNCISSLS